VAAPAAVAGTVPFGDSPFVRIIAGANKGARIFAPKGHDTRPTADRAREAAFNLIGPVDGASVLDLFAGSGAMGLEALSRGAASAVFVENDREACRAIDRNLDKLRLTGARVIQQDALRALASEAAAGRRYDLVLVDPPYEMFSSLQNGLSAYLPAVLADGGLVVVETGAKDEPELAPLAERTSRRYGSARITVFEHP
jgi:16S rRNA (guanine966-N2)-methyltransferase